MTGFRLLLGVAAAVAALTLSAVGQTIKYVPVSSLESIVAVPGDPAERLFSIWQPALKVTNGCKPHTAVGVYTASAGLRIGGLHNSGCSSRRQGQVSVRGLSFPDHNLYGIMYSYYFPKDQRTLFFGHRHDWECVIVWLKSDLRTPLGVSLSAHGGFTSISPRLVDGTHYSVQYVGYFTNHHMSRYTGVDGYYNHPVVYWDLMPPKIRWTLENAVWMDEQGKESATPKIVDAEFDTTMNKALASYLHVKGRRAVLCRGPGSRGKAC